jgi:hypothetical protein
MGTADTDQLIGKIVVDVLLGLALLMAFISRSAIKQVYNDGNCYVCHHTPSVVTHRFFVIPAIDFLSSESTIRRMLGYRRN